VRKQANAKCFLIMNLNLPYFSSNRKKTR